MIARLSIFLVVGIAVSLGACDSSSADSAVADDAAADSAAGTTANASDTVEAAAENAEPTDVEADSVESTGFSSCTSDCSGHQAGFDWAQEKDLTDESECGGDSQSFIEGCEQFVQDRRDQAEEEARVAAEAATDN